MCNSCHIRRLTKRWNSRRTWNICYIFNFQLKKIRSKIIQITLIELWSFISFELRHLNSIKMSQKAKFGFSIFQLKIKWKQIFQVRHQFGHFVKCRIWHELRIRHEKVNFRQKNLISRTFQKHAHLRIWVYRICTYYSKLSI